MTQHYGSPVVFKGLDSLSVVAMIKPLLFDSDYALDSNETSGNNLEKENSKIALNKVDPHKNINFSNFFNNVDRTLLDYISKLLMKIK